MSGVLLALSSPHPPTSLQSLQGLLGLCLGLISEYQLPPSKAAPRALLAGGVALCWSSAPASRAAPLGRACSQLFLQFPASQDQGQPSGNTDTMRQRYPVPNFSGSGPAKREHGTPRDSATQEAAVVTGEPLLSSPIPLIPSVAPEPGQHRLASLPTRGHSSPRPPLEKGWASLSNRFPPAVMPP